MKQWITQKLFLNSSLARSAFLSGTLLWSFFLIPTTYFIFSFQMNSLSSAEESRRNALEELLSNTFESSSRFGDYVNARGLILKIGSPLGLSDLGICKNGSDIIPRAFESRCLNNPDKDKNIKRVGEDIYLKFYWSNLGFDWSRLALQTFLITIILSFLMFLLTTNFYYFVLRKRILYFSGKILDESVKNTNALDSDKLLEMQPLVNSLKSYKEKINLYHLERQTLEKQALLTTIAKQVSHDIRSPLSALNLVTANLNQIPEDVKNIIRLSTRRINDIANQLLEKSKSKVGIEIDNYNNFRKASIIPLVREIVNEKIILNRSTQVLIELVSNDNTADVANIDATEFMRVVSNLLNNAIESLPYGKGLVKIHLYGKDEQLFICIKDNGIGIPTHVLEKLGSEEISFGKNLENAGSGLGIMHAFKTIKSFGGSIVIDSELDLGTTVTISIPLLS